MKINFIGILTQLFSLFFSLLKLLITPILIFIFILILLVIFNYIYLVKFKKLVPKKRTVKPEKLPSFFNKLFVKLPYQLAYDRINTDPDAFQKFGIHMICGEQGAGKTITAIYLIKRWKAEYPKSKFRSNGVDVKGEDGTIRNWKDLITFNNGIFGVINLLDEIQTWLSSNESADVPPEVLGEISQQRKQRKAIIGTAQVFGKIGKPLREQTHFVYLPKTYLKCLTIVKMAKARDYDSDKDKFKKTSGMFWFVHDKELRESYDTYKKIERYKEQKFVNSIFLGSQSAAADGNKK